MDLEWDINCQLTFLGGIPLSILGEKATSWEEGYIRKQFLSISFLP